MYDLLETGESLLKQAIKIVNETGTARSIEVTNILMRNLADISKDLLSVQKTRKDIEEDTGGSKTPSVGGQRVANQTVINMNGSDDLSSVLAELDGAVNRK